MRRSALPAVLALLCSLSIVPGPAPAAPNGCQSATLHPNANALSNGQTGQPYSERLWMTPANPCVPGLWSVSPNPPFPGVQLLPGPGADEAYLVGTPTTPGTYTFTVMSGGIIVCGAICWISQTYTVTVL